jgi:hypothetical protein
METTEKQLSRTDVVTTIAVVTTTAMVLAWYQTGLTGVQRLTNVGVAGTVTIASMILGFALLKKWDPSWSNL